MNLQTKRTISLIASIVTVVSATIGLVLIGLLANFNAQGVPMTFASELEALIKTLQNSQAIDKSIAGALANNIIVVVLYAVTLLSGLVIIIISIFRLANFKKEGVAKKLIYNTIELSVVLLMHFACMVFFRYVAGAIQIGLGLYLALALGLVGICLSALSYFLLSEKPLINKLLRIGFMLTALAASIMLLMPTITYGGGTSSPAVVFVAILSTDLQFTDLLSIAISMMVFLMVGSIMMSRTSNASVDERSKNNRNVLLIVMSVISLLIAIGGFYIVPMSYNINVLVPNSNAIIAIILIAVALVLAIVITALKKNEEPKQIELVQEAPVEEKAEAEEPAPKEEVVEEVPVEEEKTEAEEPVEEETVEEAPAEEEKVEEETPKKEVKETPKKKTTTKKPAAKKEEGGKKNNASYHLSKRASDNKWQVFRAGSDKVIKLFDTKAEAEEYTKRMAENQGVSYLSHASKGKNKGRIQKK